MTWYQKKPIESKDFKTLTETYNEKYGHYDYEQDSRSLDFTFAETLTRSVGSLGDLNVLVCGSNSGYEIEILSQKFPEARFSAVDISTDALAILSMRMPQVAVVHSCMESLPFNDKEFDVYINCRAIHSSDVDIEKAVAEATRVTKGKIVLSVSNGYRVGDAIVNGMYDYALRKIDTEKAILVANSLEKILGANDYSVNKDASEAELFLIATPHQVH